MKHLYGWNTQERQKARKIASEHGLLVDVDVISEHFSLFSLPLPDAWNDNDSG